MNHLKDYLNVVYPMVRNNLQRHSIFAPGFENDFKYKGLFEFRTISVGMPRQSGTTTKIAEIFNAETDLYVGVSKRMVEEFAYKYGSNKFMYSTIRSISFDPLRGKEFVKNIERVFVDVSICSMLDTSTIRLTYQLMQKLDNFIRASGNKKNPIYIIT